MTGGLKRFLLCLSAANLCFLRQWNQLFGPLSTWNFEPISAFPNSYVAMVVSVLVLASTLWLTLTVLNYFSARWRKPSQFAVAAFVFALVINAVRALIRDLGYFPGAWLKSTIGIFFFVLVAIAGLATLRLLQRRPDLIQKTGNAILSILLPVFVLFLFNAGRAYYQAKTTPPPPVGSYAHKNQAVNRIIWVIFDMWDQRLTFDDRPKDLKLPNIDAFAKTAFVATNANPPGSWTPLSITSLLVGRPVHEIQIDPDNRRFQLRYCGETTPTKWSDSKRFFSQLTASGFRTNLVGWHLPYCQLFPLSLASCSRYPVHNVATRRYADNLGSAISNFFSDLMIFKFSTPSTHFDHTQRMMEKTLSLARDPSVNSLFIHLPFPHDPYLYDSKKDKFVLESKRTLSYWDNLALVDKMIGELRETLESTGQWDNTAILLTSDHSASRTKRLPNGHNLLISSDHSRVELPADYKIDRRIPFMLKLAYDKTSQVYDKPFNSIITGKLLLAIAENEIRNRDQLVKRIATYRKEMSEADRCLNEYQTENVNVP